VFSSPNNFVRKPPKYFRLIKAANSPNGVRELQELERSFTVLADNAPWLRDDHDKTTHPREQH
jgi:hypothetical protein